MYQQNGLNAIFDSYSAKLNVSNSKGQSLNAYMDAVPYPLCKNYLVSSFFDRNFQWIASLVVFLTNYIFFLSADSLSGIIGHQNYTSERNATSFILFLSIFANSVLLPILVHSNFQEYGLGLASLSGRNTDFGATWYLDLGYQLCLNLFLLSLRPVFVSLEEHAYHTFQKFIKLNLLYRTHDNNQYDNIKYLELHAGPEYPF